MGTEELDEEGVGEINYMPLMIEEGLYNMKRVIGRPVSEARERNLYTWWIKLFCNCCYISKRFKDYNLKNYHFTMYQKACSNPTFLGYDYLYHNWNGTSQCLYYTRPRRYV